MIINTGGAGGGASLNYKVVGGTTSPTSPAENTIWINTDVEITSHVFSAAEPESPVVGMVWLKTSKSSKTPINVLKKADVVMIYPQSCKQYVSGEWVSKDTMIFQSGEWKKLTNFPLTLVPLGEYPADMWTASGAATWLSDGTFYSPRDVGNMTLEEKIDFTDAKSVVATVSNDGTGKSYLRVLDDDDNVVANYTTSGDYDGTFKLDVTGLTGEYRLRIGVENMWNDRLSYMTSVVIEGS